MLEEAVSNMIVWPIISCFRSKAGMVLAGRTNSEWETSGQAKQTAGNSLMNLKKRASA